MGFTMLIKQRYLLIVCIAAFLSLLACTADPSDSKPSSNSTGAASGRRSNCGVVIDGELHNPPTTNTAVSGRISKIVDAEFYVFQPEDPALGSILVKTLAARASNRPDASSYISSLLPGGGSVQLFSAGEKCDVNVRGEKGILGALVLPDGRVLTELLLTNGYLEVDRTTNYCSKRLLENCYDALAEEAPKISPHTINYFLWKPNAERDNNLVILFNPSASRVTVNGAQLAASGPSNGRSSTFRASRPGCAFRSATIKAWDREGRPLQWPGGKTEYVIPDGCQRVAF